MVAEIAIGRTSKSNCVDAYKVIGQKVGIKHVKIWSFFGGWFAVIGITLCLSFYFLIAFCLSSFNVGPLCRYTILKSPYRTHRRSLVKVLALVTPSPVGVAMVMVVKPSPSKPRPE